MKVRRITLDTCCINARQAEPNLNILETWEAAGLLLLQRAPQMLAELKGPPSRIAKAHKLGTQPALMTLGVDRLGGPSVLSGLDLGPELPHLLFPTSRSLTPNQQADVEHLRAHVRTGGHLFVTLNKNDFITRGRQAKLTSRGIWVMSPQEAVELLARLYGWSTAGVP